MSPNRGADDGPLHPAIIQIQTEQQLLNQRVETAIQAMTSHLSALQGDMQGVKSKLDQLTHAQADFTHHSTGMERLGKALEKFIEATERRWEAHEAENRSVADSVNAHRTGIRVSWALFSVLAIVLSAWGNARFTAVEESASTQFRASEQRMADHLNAGNDTKAAIQQRFQRNEADIHDLQVQLRAVRTP